MLLIHGFLVPIQSLPVLHFMTADPFITLYMAWPSNKNRNKNFQPCVDYETETKYITVKPVLSGHSKRRPKIVLKMDYCLMQVKRIAKCSKGSILQYFRPALSYHLPLRSLFCFFLSGHLRQVLLYQICKV